MYTIVNGLFGYQRVFAFSGSSSHSHFDILFGKEVRSLRIEINLKGWKLLIRSVKFIHISPNSTQRKTKKDFGNPIELTCTETGIIS